MACGQPLKVNPPVDTVEGIGSVRLPVEGLWRFSLKSHYDQEFSVDALIVPQVRDAFLIGVDFLVKKAANMDFETSELTWVEEDQMFIMPFMTWDRNTERRMLAQVPIARGSRVQDLATTEVGVAVSAEDGEIGMFIPTPRADQLLVAATLAVARAGSIKIPVVNAMDGPVTLPTKAIMGTWVPTNSDFEVLKLNGQLHDGKIAT